MREAAFLAAKGEPPPDRHWFFGKRAGVVSMSLRTGVQPEEETNEACEISPHAPEQIEQLEPEQLAIWTSAAPEPQRSILALYYLDEFNYRENDVDTGSEIARLVARDRVRSSRISGLAECNRAGGGGGMKRLSRASAHWRSARPLPL